VSYHSYEGLADWASSNLTLSAGRVPPPKDGIPHPESVPTHLPTLKWSNNPWFAEPTKNKNIFPERMPLHHLMIGTWTPPGAIFTVAFDDEKLTLELVKRTEIPHDEPISWITFDV
jgi:hypothetical protein